MEDNRFILSGKCISRDECAFYFLNIQSVMHMIFIMLVNAMFSMVAMVIHMKPILHVDSGMQAGMLCESTSLR